MTLPRLVDRNVHPTCLKASFAPVDLGPANVADIDDFWKRVWLVVDYDEVTEPKGFRRARVP